ncbi:MAG: glycosyltransferase [Corticimicrobacter sp.]|uniref:glycosyltransferase n=1 Tax=Corticimicrobacter sp. TaxID=2678536 RepID=UPI0032DAC30D
MDRRRRLQVFFLNEGFGWARTGIEVSALLRERLFRCQLGVSPVILTMRYRSDSADVYQAAISGGALDASVRFLNMYDWYQEMERAPRIGQLPAWEPGTSLRTERVPNTPGDLRVYDQSGRLTMYVFCSRMTGAISYINHMDGRKPHRKSRRDFFHPSGVLSMTQILEGEQEKVSREIYFRPDGSTALLKRYDLTQSVQKLLYVDVCDAHGRAVDRFSKEEDLALTWLRSLVERTEQVSLLVLDRSSLYLESACTLKQDFGQRVKVVPVVHAVHVSDANDLAQSRTNRHYSGFLEHPVNIDAMVVLTENQARDIRTRYGAKNIRVISHGYDIDPALCNLDFERRDRFLMVCLARYATEKRHDLALEVFASVVARIPQARLALYGNGSQRASIVEKVRTLGLEQSVTVGDFVTSVGPIYEQAGLSLMTSTSEAFSLSLVESLAHGCPVAAFNVPYAVPALVQDGINGLTVPFGQVEELADKIVAILVDAQRHKDMSLSARALAGQVTSVQACQGWSDLMAQMLQ